MRKLILIITGIAGLAGCAWASNADKVSIRQHTVFNGNAGVEINGTVYRLACAALVTDCSNGDLVCTWLSGSAKEPSTDNCMLISRSQDGGKTWSRPEIFVPAGEMASIITNLHRARNGKLVAFGANWPSAAEYTEWHYFKMESDDNGKTWSKPENFNIHGNHASMAGKPIRISENEVIYAANFYDKRKNALKATVSELATAQTESQAAGMKSVPKDGKQEPGKFGTHLHGCTILAAADESSTNFTEHGYIANRPLGLLEPTAIRVSNNRVIMLMRAEWGGYLWRADSNDNGRTWSKAYQTDIPNPSSLTFLARLPDGRIGLIHNPSGKVVGERGSRKPLSLWISSDEMKTWETKADLISGGKLAYPNAIIYKDKLVFVYDKNRRGVEFVEVEITSSDKQHDK